MDEITHIDKSRYSRWGHLKLSQFGETPTRAARRGGWAGVVSAEPWVVSPPPTFNRAMRPFEMHPPR